MGDCSSEERDEELKLRIQHFMAGSPFASAAIVVSYECPLHGIDVQHYTLTQPLPNKREHVRKLIERMRQYADSLEAHYFGADPHEPVKRSHGSEN